MQDEIFGGQYPGVAIQLEAGESILAEAGEMMWMDQSIRMTTSTQFGGGGGMLGMFKRTMSGSTLFMTEFKADGNRGSVTFPAKVPGTIQRIVVGPGKGYVVHRHGFMAAQSGIKIEPQVQKIGAGLLGGEGLILQKLSAPSDTVAFVELAGAVQRFTLNPGEVKIVHPGHIGMFSEGVGFEIRMLKGIKNKFFGGDGLFQAVLTGPGEVYLQTLTVPNLAHAIMPYLPTNEK